MTKQNQVTLQEALAIAQKHHQVGNLTLAERTYKDILQTVPDNFQSLHFLGIICYQAGKPEEGLEFTKKAIAINDEQADTWNAYGVMLAQVGNYEEALGKWEKAIEIKPDFFEAYSNMGNALWELGRFEESKKACEKAVELAPEFVGGYNNLGLALASLDKKEEAIETWNKGLEVAPTSPDPMINIGNALCELGRPSESEEYCRKALELSPDNSKALYNLGNAQRDQGKLKEAEESYRKAIAVEPSFVDAYNNLSSILIQLHRHEEALTSARYIIAFKPDHATAYYIQAIALKEMGHLEKAEKSARKSLELNPDFVESKVELADILFMSDKYDEAETLLVDAMEEMEGNRHNLYLRLSTVLERLNRIDEALEAVEKAMELSPETPEIYYRKAMIHYMNNKTEKALEIIDEALKMRPEFVAALGFKSEVLQSLGKMDEALDITRQAMEMGSVMPSLYLTMSKIKKFTDKDDPDLKRMVELSEKPVAKGYAQKTSINFALFKAYEDLGEYEKAFEHLKIGNDTKRANSVYDKTAQDITFANLKRVFTPEFFEKLKGKGAESDKPIFIVGMPRSGTTLTEQIIMSHPEVYGAGELPYLTEVEKKFGVVSEENCREMGQEYVDIINGLNEESKNARKVTDKMPGNFIRIGQIAATLPNAKIIHCRRNPMDTCLSCYKQLFARGHYWTFNLDEMAEHYEMYRKTMDYWREVLPDKFLEIDYETTVDDFENQARKLIDYVELEWDDACLTPHKTKRSVLTASKGQVIQPIYKTSVEAWRRYEKQLDPLYQKLKKYMD
jgi:tetratricopeptide (TPR) repeat protein